MEGSEKERIERERYESPDAIGLSVSARDLLRRIISGRVEITPDNRPAFRELAAARIIILGHSFAGGRGSIYRWTYWSGARSPQRGLCGLWAAFLSFADLSSCVALAQAARLAEPKFATSINVGFEPVWLTRGR